MGGEPISFPIQLLINYWETRPSLMGARLTELTHAGIYHVATFLPWQCVESDISHTLTRFLQAAAEKKIAVSLILSPELGIHYPNSGLPKDLMSRPENRAGHAQNGPIPVVLPPNAFNLPSIFAPEYSKRYYSYLARVDSQLADLKKLHPGILDHVNLVLTGSFWKYYRTPAAGASGVAGDFSPQAATAYRQRLDFFFSQREFMDPTPASANRWKTRSMEEVNRRWFYQHSEDVFRARSLQQLRKKSGALRANEIELYTPEADASMGYSAFLQAVSGGHADFSRLSRLIEDAAARASFGSQGETAPFIHWTSMGGFRALSDPEKQFLILKSLLLLGGQGGGVLIDEKEWSSFSQVFRGRSEALARSLANGELKLQKRALYLSPHLWSSGASGGLLWDELVRKVGVGVRRVASLDLVLRDSEAGFVVVDPLFVMTREVVQKLVAWAKSGRVVVLPRSELYTESARIELEQMTADHRRIEIDLGIPYVLHAIGEGKLIVYDLPGGLSLKSEPVSAWQSFIAGVLSLADLETHCRLSDSRLEVIPLQHKRDRLALFVMNGTRRQVGADILFQKKVRVRDLAVILANTPSAQMPAGAAAKSDPVPEGIEDSSSEEIAPASRFALEAPAYGILPLSVEGLPLGDEKERQEAKLTAEAFRESALSAVASELPGFDASNLEEAWN